MNALRPQRHGRTEDDLGAYAVLDAAWPVIARQHDYDLTRKAWRQRNKAAALTLSRAMRSPGDPQGVAAVLEWLMFAFGDPKACTFYGTMTSLNTLIENIPRLRAMREGTSGPRPANRMYGKTGARIG